MTTNQTAAAELPTPPAPAQQSTLEVAGSEEPRGGTAARAAIANESPEQTEKTEQTAETDHTAGTGGVTNGRARIDALDEQIADLILRRGDVSREIQAARIADGGRRVDLRRETEIITRYTAALGRPGTAIAMALLELGRGRA